MCSSSSSDEDEWRFYRDRPEWKDVQPVFQDDGPDPKVVPIAYSEKFQDVYNYFRAVRFNEEKSKRALEVCTDALILNAANYTVWSYRREILKHLKCDLNSELEFVADIIERNPKNYQVWHHRRMIVEWIGDGQCELPFTAKILKIDCKNYHAWQHRQWIILRYDLFDGELDFADQLISEDIRNNSAWNHRYFVINHWTGFEETVVDREISYTLEAIRFAPSNESPWNYLRGVLKFTDEKLNDPRAYSVAEELYFLYKCTSIHLLIYLADAAMDSFKENPEQNLPKFSFALELLEDLSCNHDKIRSAYWRAMAEEFKDDFIASSSTSRSESRADLEETPDSDLPEYDTLKASEPQRIPSELEPSDRPRMTRPSGTASKDTSELLKTSQPATESRKGTVDLSASDPSPPVPQRTTSRTSS